MLTSFLDFVVTACGLYGFWVAFAALILASAFYVFIENKNISKKIFLTCIIAFPVFPFAIFIFVSFINPSLFGFGYITDNIDIVAQEENILLTMDSTTHSGGEVSESYVTHRLQSINLDTGATIFRKPMGSSFEALGSKNQYAWGRRGKDIVGINLQTGDAEIVVNEKNLMKNFPEVHKGVYEYTYNPETFLIDVVSKDGLTLSIDPTSNTKVSNTPQPIEPKNMGDYRIKDDYAVVQNNTALIALSNDKAQKLVDAKGRVLNTAVTFLKAKFLQFDERTQQVVVLSYETLEKKDFIIRSISLEGELIWEVKQRDIPVGDIFSRHPTLTANFFYKDKIIFVFHGFLFSLSMSDGQVNWVKRI